MSELPLTGKRILISAGPTWVPIDAVRHIGNFATGRLGLALARETVRLGGAATLLLGPTPLYSPEADQKQIEIRRYTYFDELHALVREAVGSGNYHAFLHSAAVSDY
ncbi:MAG TPA: phosphopantothenoylcysteine decarboxylase [Armatimonadota bacterium]|nr:phosphopantothenoylcysteine decarboxylase [Armatimonadota bacterium]